MSKQVPFPKPENYIPLNHDEPIISYKHKRTFITNTCTVTGEFIPRFSLAWQKQTDWLIRDMIHTEKEWMSEKGYMLEILKGNANTKNSTDDPGPW